jgi:predicted transcriptional regulator YheO
MTERPEAAARRTPAGNGAPITSPPDGHQAAGSPGLLPAVMSRERDALVQQLASLVVPLGSALPGTCEVLVHDLAKLPNSIVAIHGNVTGRRIGDPATDLLLKHVVEDRDDPLIGYETRLQDGRRVRSSTVIVRDTQGMAVAAICINTDVSAWLDIRGIAAAMISGHRVDPALVTAVSESSRDRRSEPEAVPEIREEFFTDVDELAAYLLKHCIDDVGIPVELMKKEHKLRVVEQLRNRGMFLLRESVETVAAALDVSRFTVYNYLKDLDSASHPD